jgi:hypothetical protein
LKLCVGGTWRQAATDGDRYGYIYETFQFRTSDREPQNDVGRVTRRKYVVTD